MIFLFFFLLLFVYTSKEYIREGKHIPIRIYFIRNTDV